ncbi:Hypothetical protein SMAX5B_001629 [Scophthalmus maximus]|uniref:Uncharacterized protein n=1 Tax=Scophthalmus maximus TaxID=52904 RepID=A0A2U9CVX9_SCOMX|nr:Hypothetical protein SMAX5B_001629 [Scophthalmus maximus]
MRQCLVNDSEVPVPSARAGTTCGELDDFTCGRCFPTGRSVCGGESVGVNIDEGGDAPQHPHSCLRLRLCRIHSADVYRRRSARAIAEFSTPSPVDWRI